MVWLFRDNTLDIADKIQLVIAYVLQLTLIAAIIYSLLQQNWFNAFVITGILILTLIPAIVQHSYRVYIPVEFHLATILFVFASLYLGEIQAYFTYFWWWDVVLHTASGMLLGLAGFTLVYVLNKEKRSQLQLSPLFLAIFSFVFAVAIGAIWEIIEFSLDQAFGTNLQKSGLVDTMWDLIVDVAGALFISVIGYFYIKSHDSLLINRFVHRFVNKNYKLFRRPLRQKFTEASIFLKK